MLIGRHIRIISSVESAHSKMARWFAERETVGQRDHPPGASCDQGLGSGGAPAQLTQLPCPVDSSATLARSYHSPRRSVPVHLIGDEGDTCPLQSEMTVSTESTIPNARAFVRSLNVLLKYTRLYGLDHLRSAASLKSAGMSWSRRSGRPVQVACCWGPPDRNFCSMACRSNRPRPRRSFADLLNAAGVASIAFLPSVARDEFDNLS